MTYLDPSTAMPAQRLRFCERFRKHTLSAVSVAFFLLDLGAMTTVTRFIGNCQVCEGDFKATPDGRVALHGYRRPGGGYIVGRCPGEAQPAYERDRNMIPALIAMEDREIASRKETIQKIDAGTLDRIVRPRFSLRGGDVVHTPSDHDWELQLRRYREEQERAIQAAKVQRKHYEKRYDDWKLLPLREIDEEGRTAEQRAATVARKGAQAAARSAKEEKARALAKKRGEVLLERKALLDHAGEKIRQAATQDDREAALAVLRELGKKKHATTLEPSFASFDPIAVLKRRGVLPADLPDVGEKLAYHWEGDLHADDALLQLGLARRNSNLRSGIEYESSLWRAGR